MTAYYPLNSISTHFVSLIQVTVYSKNNDDEQHCWESAAGGSFVVTRDDSLPITRGTRIVLLLKEDMQEVISSGQKHIGTHLLCKCDHSQGNNSNHLS